jgi:toxin ParE1/3/4
MGNKIEKIIWSNPAVEDLNEIFLFLEITINIDKAEEITTKIYQRVDDLFDFPEMGTIAYDRYEIKSKYRYLVEKPYKILYNVVNDIVYIEAVYDTRQDPMRTSF